MDTMDSSGRSMMRPLLIVVFIGLLALTVVLEMQRRAAADQLRQLSVRLEQLQGGNTQQNQEAARRIVDMVRRHMDIPTDIEPTVATIIDVETLRERNPFYAKAKNGDHLIVTPERAILYDAENDKILDVVPVQLEQRTEPAPTPTPEAPPAQ